MHLTIAFNVAYLVHSFLVITVQGIRKWWVLLATLYGICLFMLYTLSRTCGPLQLYTSTLSRTCGHLQLNTSTLSRTCGHLQLQHFYSETYMWSPAAVHFFSDAYMWPPAAVHFYSDTYKNRGRKVNFKI